MKMRIQKLTRNLSNTLFVPEKMRIMTCVLLLWVMGLAHAQVKTISGYVVDDSQKPIDYAIIKALDNDSVGKATCMSDSMGYFFMEIDSTLVSTVVVSKMGYITQKRSMPIDSRIVLPIDNQLLEEVTIVGKASLIKKTDTGLCYDIKNNRFAKNQNVLQAMRFVPMIDVSADGTLSVIGHDKYQIYLNGRRYDMAEANLKSVLQSMPANKIKQIEVITETDKRFFNDGVVIINIIAENDLLDGFYSNSFANGTTQPTAKLGTSILGKKKAVDFSLTYDYDLDTQRSQPIEQNYIYADRNVNLIGKGDGDWQTHIFRSLFKWQIDSINTIYADIHVKMLQTDFTTKWNQYASMNETGIISSDSFDNQNKNRSGTTETNLIYRNYFKQHPTQERIAVGYRYTYNPDHRHFIQLMSDETSQYATQTIQTDGGLHEHTLNASYTTPMFYKMKISVGGKSIWRKGSTHSSDHSDIAYNQNIIYPYLKLAGSFWGTKVSMNVSGEWESLTMDAPYAVNGAERKNESFYFTPSLTLSRNLPNQMRLNLDYKRSTQRPTILMLNPFVSTQNNYVGSTGNPDLCAETNDMISLGLSKFTKRLYLSAALTYSQKHNTIVYHQRGLNEEGVTMYSYDNMGKETKVGGNIFVNWQPVSAFVFKCNVNGGYYGLQLEDKKQNDYILNFFCWADYYMNHNWNIGLNLIHYKQQPEPYSTINANSRYSLHIGKSWLNGRLSANVEVSTPFQKYVKMEVNTSNQNYVVRRVNYMTARYIGLNISYTIGKGKKSQLKRDTSVKQNDQNNGVG